MNISTDTIAVLKNFSDINQNILIKPGNTVQTISTMKNILAEAEITEKFDSEFAIYDLPEFLRSVELFEKPQLKFNGESNVKIESGAQSVKYFFADKSVIVAPKKSINMPDKHVTFTLKKDVFTQLMKGATTLNLPDIAVKSVGNDIIMSAIDKKNDTANTYDVKVGTTDKKFVFHFKTEHFKMLPGDYTVLISSKLISNFRHKNKTVQYWIALENTSKYEG